VIVRGEGDALTVVAECHERRVTGGSGRIFLEFQASGRERRHDRNRLAGPCVYSIRVELAGVGDLRDERIRRVVDRYPAVDPVQNDALSGGRTGRQGDDGLKRIVPAH
jgi:hypothetical protein